MITKHNLPIHELIGLRAKVADSLSIPYRGISGSVVDETKNTLVLRKGDGTVRRVPKRGCVFEFVPGKGKPIRIDGGKIAFRPYDRPKKLKSGSV